MLQLVRMKDVDREPKTRRRNEKLISCFQSRFCVMMEGEWSGVADEGKATSGGVSWWEKRRTSEVGDSSGTRKGDVGQNEVEAGAEVQNGLVPSAVSMQLVPGQMLVSVGHVLVLVQQGKGPSSQAGGSHVQFVARMRGEGIGNGKGEPG